MFRLIALLALCVAVAFAGYAHHGHGHGGGHGHGWGHKYVGWANVNAWSTPWAYQYGLNEHGNGYNKYIWQGQEFSKGHHGGWQG